VSKLFLVTRCCLTVVGIAAGLAFPAAALFPMTVGASLVLLWLQGWRRLIPIAASVAVLALPLLVVHAMINPMFPVTHHVGLIPWRAGGWEYTLVLTQRFAMLFAAVSVWIGVPGMVVVALLARLNLPTRMGLILIYAVVLVGVLKRRISAIQSALRSRGALDGKGPRGKAYALVAMTVPLIATTLLEAVARSEVRGRLGNADLLRLRAVAGLSRPNTADVTCAALMLIGTIALVTLL
jgi:hypothetical protein